MRVVLDTGILIAALITADTPPDRVYQAWRKKRFTLITSAWQLGEFRRASRYERVKAFLKPTEAGNLVNGLKHHAIVLTELPKVRQSDTRNGHRRQGRLSGYRRPARLAIAEAGRHHARGDGRRVHKNTKEALTRER